MKVLRELGRGSFATVSLAERDGQLVAVKSMSVQKYNKKLAENLMSEIQILKTLSHPHIVALYDLINSDDQIHLIMEYCSLGDLSAFIKTKHISTDKQVNLRIAGPFGGLTEPIVFQFLRQLVSAVLFLRQHSLIHRDLKPQNVLLAPALSNTPPFSTVPFIPAIPNVKLADFGFARMLPAQSLASTVCGSPLYMAPEILRGDKYDARVDLWSLGAILYEMIYSRPPFKAQNHIELLRMIERGDGNLVFPGEDPGFLSDPRPQSATRAVGFPLRFTPPNLTTATPTTEVHPDLKDLMRKLLKRNPQERLSFDQLSQHPSILEMYPQTSPSIIPSSPSRTTSLFQPHSLPRNFGRPTSHEDMFKNSQSIIKYPQTKRVPSNEALSPVSPRFSISPNFMNPTLREMSSPPVEFQRCGTSSIVFPKAESLSFPTLAISMGTDSSPPIHSPQHESFEHRKLKRTSSKSSRLSASSNPPEIPFPEYNLDPSVLQYLSDLREPLKEPGGSNSSSSIGSISVGELLEEETVPSIETPKKKSEDFIIVEKGAVQINWLADQMPQTNERSGFPVLKPNWEHSLLKTFNLCGLRALAVHRLIASLSSDGPVPLFGLWLFVLSLYQHAMNVGKMLWDQKSTMRASEVKILIQGIQWVRSKFNECLSITSTLPKTQDPIPIKFLYHVVLEISQKAALMESEKDPSMLYQHAIFLLEALLTDGLEVEIKMQDSQREEMEGLLVGLYKRLGL